MTRQTVAVEQGGVAFRVDTRLAPLLEAVWALGVRTRSSRVIDGPDTAHLSFDTTADAVAFLNAVTSADEPDVPDTWQWRADARNRAEEPGRPDTPDHTMRLRLSFPTAHLQHVTTTAAAKAPPLTAA